MASRQRSRSEKLMKKIPEITVQNLDHLGLVAGIIDRIEIVEKINQLVGCQPGEIQGKLI